MPDMIEIKCVNLTHCPYSEEIREDDNEYCICPKCANRSSKCDEAFESCQYCVETFRQMKRDLEPRMRQYAYLHTISNCTGFERK